MVKTPVLLLVACMLAADWGAQAQVVGGSAGSAKSDTAKSPATKDADAASSAGSKDTLSEDTSAALYYPWVFSDLKGIAAKVAADASAAATHIQPPTPKLLLVSNPQEIRTAIQFWRYFNKLQGYFAGASQQCLTDLSAFETEVNGDLRNKEPRNQASVAPLPVVPEVLDLAKGVAALFSTERSMAGRGLTGIEASYRDMVAACLLSDGWRVCLPGLAPLDDTEVAKDVLDKLGDLSLCHAQIVDWQLRRLPALRQRIVISSLSNALKGSWTARLDAWTKECESAAERIDSFLKSLDLDQASGLRNLVEGAVCEGVPCLVLRVDAARGSTLTRKGAWSGTRYYAGAFLAASYELYDGGGVLVGTGMVTSNDPTKTPQWVVHQIELP